MSEELKIQIDEPEDLKELNKFLRKKLNENIDISTIMSQSPGFAREPIITAIIIALKGGPLVTEIAGLLKEWIQYKRDVKKIEYEEKKLKLTVLTGKVYRKISVDDLNRLK